MYRTLLPALALLLAGAADHATPSWMKIDADRKLVTLDMVAGWNPNNGALNFNGYSTGDMTVVVPPGWRVNVAVLNHDGMLPHSLLVSKTYAKDDIPLQLGAQEVAISKAYTGDPIAGLGPNEKDSFDFRAPADGEFWFVCGVPGHAVQGMYVDLRVDPAAAVPYVTVADPKAGGRS